MTPARVSELFSKCHARIGRAVHHSNEAAKLWNNLDIMHLLAVTLLVRDDGTGTLDVDQVEPLPENLDLELGEFLYQLPGCGRWVGVCVCDSRFRSKPSAKGIFHRISHLRAEGRIQTISKDRAAERRQATVHRGDPTVCRAAARGSSLGLEFESMPAFLERTSSEDRHRRLHTLIAAVSTDRPLFELPEGTRLEKVEVRPMGSSEGPAARFSLTGWQRGMKLSANPHADIDLWLEGLAASCHQNDTLPHRLQSITMNVRMIVSFLEKNEWLLPSL